VWDERGIEGPWSEPTHWTLGILKPEEWQAKWIGLDGGEPETPAATDAAAARWIAYPEGEPEKAAPVGAQYFRRTFEIPADRAVARAVFYVTGDNQASAFVNGHHVGDARSFRSLSEFSIVDALQPGRNTVAVAVHNVGDGPNPAGLIAVVRIEFAEGDPLVVTTDAQWRASNAEAADWNAAAFDDSAWAAAQDLGPSDMQPWGRPKAPESRVLPARMLRREFELRAPVKRAVAYLCGLGLSELYVNGDRIGDDVLSPGLTEYDKRAYYVAYDVTDQLQSGRNALGVWLGNGRYYAPRTGEPTSTRTYGYPKLLFHLRLEMADGSVGVVASDEAWKLTTDGPIRANNEYDGEVYDARKELPGWAEPGFDDSQWQPAQLVDGPGGVLSAQMMEPIKVTEVLHPIALTNPKPGVYIYDMGQNMVGWCRLKVSGPAGTRVRPAARGSPARRRHTLPRQHPRREGHRRVLPQGRGRRGLRTALYLPRFPLRRVDRLPRPARPRDTRGLRRPRRRRARRQLRMLGQARQQHLPQHRLGRARQLPQHPHRLPAA
jgi:alpha-L-rhamnosidase